MIPTLENTNARNVLNVWSVLKQNNKFIDACDFNTSTLIRGNIAYILTQNGDYIEWDWPNMFIYKNRDIFTIVSRKNSKLPQLKMLQNCILTDLYFNMWDNSSASYFDTISQYWNLDSSSSAFFNKKLYTIFPYLLEIMLLNNKFEEDSFLFYHLVELEASKNTKIYSLVDSVANSSSKAQYIKAMITLFFSCIPSFEEYTCKKFANTLFRKCFIELVNSEDCQSSRDSLLTKLFKQPTFQCSYTGRFHDDEINFWTLVF